MKIIARLVLVLAILGGAGAYYWLYMRSHTAGVPEDAIRISGNIEVVDVEVSFKIAGRVLERLVDEGEEVRAGQVVARLESSDLEKEVHLRRGEVKEAEAKLAENLAGSRPEEIAEAQAKVEQAQAELDELMAGSRPQEIASSRATVARAKAELENFEREYRRQKKLYEEGVVSEEAFETATKDLEVARARLKEEQEKLKLVEEGPRKEEIEQAKARLVEAIERYARIKKGPRQEVIDQARAALEQAQANLALAETRLGYATVTAPMAGVVLSKNIEPGEYVSPGTPVVTIGDIENVWLRGYISETDLGRVKLGQKAHVYVDTFPGKVYEGKVSFIASNAEFTPKNVQTEKERVKLVYRVKVDIHNPHHELKPGMPADADLLIEGS